MIASYALQISRVKDIQRAYNMNQYFILAAVGLLAAAPVKAEAMEDATTEQQWAHGVTAKGGWYDANKTCTDDYTGGTMGEYPNDPSGYGAKTDDNMCYAASAANLLAWWQNLYEPVPGVPQGVTDIWKTFVNNSTTDGGGNFTAAISWWFNGMTDRLTPLAPFDGYYQQYTKGESVYDQEKGNTFVTRVLQPTCRVLVNALQSGKGISLKLEKKGSFHSITVWGVEYANDRLTKMWITDSDDDKHLETPQARLLEIDVDGTDGNYTVNFGTDSTYSIHTAYLLDPSISDTWGLTRAIPEPTSATLAVLALSALGLRRKRR